MQSKQEISIPAANGICLAATYHQSNASSHKAVLICPAIGVTAKFYTSFAEFLSEQGFDVVRMDYQGMGLSTSDALPDNLPTMQSWAENDVDAALCWIKQHLQAQFIAIVGHSAGGQLAGISGTQVSIDAMILVASQSGYWRHWSGKQRLKMYLLWHLLIPILSKALGRFPARALKLGEDLPKHVALQWAGWGKSADYMASDEELAHRFSSYAGPILAYGFSDDTFAPPKAVSSLLSYYSNAMIERRDIDVANFAHEKIGHFGYFRSNIARDSLWIECVTWLNSQASHS